LNRHRKGTSPSPSAPQGGRGIPKDTEKIMI
jgi:hypothetical protein